MRIMNKITFLLLFVFGVSLNVSAQNNNFTYNGKPITLSNKLEEHYGAKYVSNLKSNNVDLLLYLNYFVDYSYSIEDVGEKVSNDTYKNISVLTKQVKSLAPDFVASNNKSFNILAYGIQLKPEQQVFKTGFGNNAIIVLPKKQFIANFNDYRDSLSK